MSTSDKEQKYEARIKEILEEIRRVEQFTCEYWGILLKEWQISHENRIKTPTQGKIIEGIIKTRSEYVAKLREEVDFLMKGAIENNKKLVPSTTASEECECSIGKTRGDTVGCEKCLP